MKRQGTSSEEMESRASSAMSPRIAWKLTRAVINQVFTNLEEEMQFPLCCQVLAHHQFSSTIIHPTYIFSAQIWPTLPIHQLLLCFEAAHLARRRAAAKMSPQARDMQPRYTKKVTSSENIAAKTLEGKTTRQEECWAALGRGWHTLEVLLLIHRLLCGRGEALRESDHKIKQPLTQGTIYQIYKLCN